MATKRMNVDTSVEGIKKNYDVTEEVMTELDAEGLKLPDRPKDDKGNPEEALLPQDLTVLTPQDLGKIYTRFTSYADYVAGKLSIAEHTKSKWKVTRDAILAKLRYIKEGDQVTDRSDQARIDPQFLEADREVLRAECKFQLVGAVMNRCNKDLKLISREISRRQMEWDRTNRGQNLDGASLRPRKTRFGPNR